MLRKIINGKMNSVASAAVLLGLASLASRFLGILRDHILAGKFGVGNDLDIYYAAFRIPDLVFNIVVLGALSAGFIPVFASLLARKKEKEAWETANIVLNFILVLLAAACLVLIVFTPQIINLIVPGFSQEKKDFTITLTRIMFLAPFFLTLSSVVGGILQSFQRFFFYSLAPVMYNIGIIIGALVFVEWWGIYGLAWGVVLGALLHFLIQLPTVYHLGFRYRWIWDLKNIELRKIIKMMIPRTLTLFISQLNLIVITVIASTLAAGSLVVFNFANNLQNLPLGLFAFSFAVASFPVFSTLSSQKKMSEFAERLSLVTRQILFLTVPASVLMIILRAQIVRVVLGTGKFSWTDTILTLETLQFFALSLFAQGLIPLFARAFWSLHNTKTPFLIALISMLINLAGCLIIPSLANPWASDPNTPFGVTGLAIAFSLSSIVNAALLFILISQKVKQLNKKEIFISSVKISLAAIIAGMSAYQTLYFMASLINMRTFIGVLVQGSAAGIVGVLVYLLVSWILESKELILLKSVLRRKIFKTKIKTVEVIENE